MSNDLTGIRTIEQFEVCIKKLTIAPSELTAVEKDYILTVAVLLMKKFSLDKRHISYVELAYFIILNYSLAFSDYAPLYDFSISFGLYPISFSITKNNLLSFENIANSLIESRILKEFTNGTIIETYEQKQLYNDIIYSDKNEKSFIAPTSFGKSHLILSHIKSAFSTEKKFAIIVPTKALLMQTYRDVKALNLKIRIIMHDEMYQENDLGFIGVFTQERAFRLINKHNISFDFMYIDEAHQLLEKDSRSILLTRLIKLNKKLNSNCKVFYFSPLISDTSNIILDETQNISEKRVFFNLKEPRLFEYQTNNKKRIYNRFVNKFYPLGSSATNLFEYIEENKGKKNFIYFYTPRKIQQFANDLASRKIAIKDSENIDEIVTNLNKYVHADFYLTECLKKGILYVHGKLPDSVRDYLLTKFTMLSELSTVIANKVILEGVNLPIDTLFIMQGSNLKQKDLINLIGRVNRLNEIFGETTNFQKLQPPIHFVNSDEYNRQGGNLANKIKLLKKTSYVDEIENPLLRKSKSPKDKKEYEIAESIKQDDEIFFSVALTEVEQLKKKIVGLGLSTIYKELQTVAEILWTKFSKNIFSTSSEGNTMPIMDRFNWLFISDLEDYIIDEEVSRLRNAAAISYYKMFLENRKLSLNEKISREVSYFKKRINTGDAYLYIGYSFGEIPYPYDINANNKVYVDLSNKTEKELINLAIIKQKQEEDFVSFKLFMFFQLMLDYNQLTEDEYESIIYGSNDKMDIQLVKLGLPINLVSRLRNDHQVDNIYLDENNNIQCKDEFLEYKKTLDDFLRFEIDRVL